MSGAEESSTKIQFRKKNVKSLRKRAGSSENDDSDEKTSSIRERLREMKTLQKFRHRPHGVNIAGLALGEKITANATSDPFNVKNGGMVNMAALKNTKLKQANDAYDTGIGTQFSAETNKRDEDEEMMKYIEEQLSKRKNKSSGTSNAEGNGGEGSYCSPEEAALQAVPEHLRQSSANTSEEMLSNQMLSGIPEVDLGIEAKIRNIEATEEAKLKLLWERHRKKDGPSQFVPTNMAVNFVQHNRFNIEDADAQKSKRDAEERRRLNARNNDAKEKRKDNGEKATDDYHYERFKKQFRRF
ncbi:telomere length and silencing protein 1 homolog [Athalia rosae]|uniref:telomere length and silencing protein 1 homolog n=1 Tax=Athalia rosae TaxID=37344 RepID=UPI0020341EA1|nr:telomere length and silencing protein 1 homolog [Athalia rosae]XP_020708480.2 telomere length and silencing protein 1 homolog [Athalia rosae]XP_048509143.1 telomere length and silencing protein 1 homolog [Athalia rosae]